VPPSMALCIILAGLMWLLMRFYGDHGMRLPRCPFCGGEGHNNHSADCRNRDRW
jgi:hypothetical protein